MINLSEGTSSLSISHITKNRSYLTSVWKRTLGNPKSFLYYRNNIFTRHKMCSLFVHCTDLGVGFVVGKYSFIITSH